MFTIPTLQTDNPTVNMAFRMAIGDMFTNVSAFQDGMLTQPSPVMLAGVGYDTPWTRDAAINTWNGGGLLYPEVAKNTLLSVVVTEHGKNRIGGEYWDAIIWAEGARWYCLYTGDEAFRAFAADVIENSLAFFEATEFNAELNLFRGPACYGDGCSAYPDVYQTGQSGIKRLPEFKPEMCVPVGEGVPMHTLSTNCLYYQAYRVAFEMTGKPSWQEKAERMKAAINQHFWNESRGLYDYIVDDFGGCSHSEGMGQSFAMLFGIADEEKCCRIAENQPVSENGIPCLYPGFDRYGPYGMPRHAETVWPQIQAFWADAVAKYAPEKFAHEFLALARNAVRDGFFSEVYHPQTGERFGGWQEWRNQTVEWKSEIRQMWCATGFFRMTLFDLAGMRFEEDGIHIAPTKIGCVNSLCLRSLKYRQAEVSIMITPDGWNKQAFIPASATGNIEIRL